MTGSFLPKPFAHTYEIDPRFSKSAVYFSCEFAIDQIFKIYSGGLGFLAGSHMRSAAAMRQNLCGIGMLWTYGYYDQARGEEREMAVQFRKKQYAFLQDTGIKFQVPVHGHPVWVKAMFLPGDIFGTVPMFFLTTDIDENDGLSRAITHRLYDNDPLRRIAQYIILGAGGARLLEELGVDPEVWHLNEAHGLAAAFRVYEKHRSVEEVKKRFVFTTHTPEEAGNEKHDFKLLHDFSFFGSVPIDEVRQATGIQDDIFNHSLAALRLSHLANAVSKLHGDVSRKMWESYPGICPITHVTNAQNAKYWTDRGLEHARQEGNADELRSRKHELKSQLFQTVANQTGKLFNPDVITLVWARRFAGYKRPDLITRDIRMFRALINNNERPVQIIWAGKPFPFDFGAIETFNHLVQVTKDFPNVALGMVWGGKGAFATWFSPDIDCIHGINWLPFTPASIYMGRHPGYVKKNHDRIVGKRLNGKDYNNGWGDLIVMFNALSDPASAAAYLDATPDCLVEGGNTHAFMDHWIGTLDALGTNAAAVTASHPFTNVFIKNGSKTYVAYNFGAEPLAVSFSDGTKLTAAPKKLTVRRGQR